MAYSRWLTSNWYTFWCASDASCKDDEIFSVMGSISTGVDITFKEIHEDTKGALTKVQLSEEDYSYSDKEMDELMGYMQEFEVDVIDHYNRLETGEAIL